MMMDDDVDTSDYDFVLPLGEEAAAYAKEIRQRFMASLVSQQVSSKNQIRHEVSNDTVKWRDKQKACYVSLNVSHASKTRDALAVTAWLKAFYCWGVFSLADPRDGGSDEIATEGTHGRRKQVSGRYAQIGANGVVMCSFNFSVRPGN